MWTKQDFPSFCYFSGTYHSYNSTQPRSLVGFHETDHTNLLGNIVIAAICYLLIAHKILHNGHGFLESTVRFNFSIVLLIQCQALVLIVIFDDSSFSIHMRLRLCLFFKATRFRNGLKGVLFDVRILFVAFLRNLLWVTFPDSILEYQAYLNYHCICQFWSNRSLSVSH